MSEAISGDNEEVTYDELFGSAVTPDVTPTVSANRNPVATPAPVSYEASAQEPVTYTRKKMPKTKAKVFEFTGGESSSF